MRPFQTIVKDPVPERTMTTSQIRIKAVNRLMKQRDDYEAQEEARLNAISIQETMRVSTTGAMRKLIKSTRPMLALDVSGRPYLLAKDSGRDTLELIKELVKSYTIFEEGYPAVVLLSPLRRLSLGDITHYKVGQLMIPIHFETESFEAQNYDVMVRGK